MRRLLCQAMLDPSAVVRVAADDALKKIDSKLQYLAVGLVTSWNAGSPRSKYQSALFKLRRLKEDAEPLTPLVYRYAWLSFNQRDISLVEDELTVLSLIAPNDQRGCKTIAAGLSHNNANVRHAALQAIGRMKHGRQSLKRILGLLRGDNARNRIAAIEALTSLVDDNTEDVVRKAIQQQRYHPDETVRQAVAAALNKLENRKQN